ncbi:hypothetical protein [Pseudoduganella namucuonensis]|uniref:Uncharacterized protein n=1 Tax=Pseudoduganella namucuonensis TaxID=1035707 RepID=A0A1I7ILX5_9BURK|nr:hypothetical protein [Pseudoduganella namucuonensis]SFU73917.1 hypothetical protein SAMN05216552_1008133 [Pseudoduganella namucuonensis]
MSGRKVFLCGIKVTPLNQGVAGRLRVRSLYEGQEFPYRLAKRLGGH